MTDELDDEALQLLEDALHWSGIGDWPLSAFDDPAELRSAASFLAGAVWAGLAAPKVDRPKLETLRASVMTFLRARRVEGLGENPVCAWCESELLPTDDKHHYDGLVYCSGAHRADHLISTGRGKGRSKTIGTHETFIGIGLIAQTMVPTEKQILCMKEGESVPPDRYSRAALEGLWKAVLVWPDPQHHQVLHTPLGRRVRALLLDQQKGETADG